MMIVYEMLQSIYGTENVYTLYEYIQQFIFPLLLLNNNNNNNNNNRNQGEEQIRHIQSYFTNNNNSNHAEDNADTGATTTTTDTSTTTTRTAKILLQHMIITTTSSSSSSVSSSSSTIARTTNTAIMDSTTTTSINNNNDHNNHNKKKSKKNKKKKTKTNNTHHIKVVLQSQQQQPSQQLPLLPPPQLTKVRLPLIPPQQSLDSLVQDLIQSILISSSSTASIAATSNPSRKRKRGSCQQKQLLLYSIKTNTTTTSNNNILCHGYKLVQPYSITSSSSVSNTGAAVAATTAAARIAMSTTNQNNHNSSITSSSSSQHNNPNTSLTLTTTTQIVQQVQINPATEYCMYSKLFTSLLHEQILGDDIIRYLLQYTNIFIPIIVPVVPSPLDINHSKKKQQQQQHQQYVPIIQHDTNYWQICGIPIHHHPKYNMNHNQKRVAKTAPVATSIQPSLKTKKKRKTSHSSTGSIQQHHVIHVTRTKSNDNNNNDDDLSNPIMNSARSVSTISMNPTEYMQQQLQHDGRDEDNDQKQHDDTIEKISEDTVMDQSLIVDPMSTRRKSGKKRKRPLQHCLQESLNLSSLSAQSCIYRNQLFYSNSYNKSINKNVMFAVVDDKTNNVNISCNNKSTDVSNNITMTPQKLWRDMNQEWTDTILQSDTINTTSDQIIDICSNILHQHRNKVDYIRLLNHHCPLPSTLKSKTKSIKDDKVDISDMVHLYTPHNNVIAFVQACLKGVFPGTFWDKNQLNKSTCYKPNYETTTTTVPINNEIVFMEHILPTFITLRRNERLPNKMILNNIRTTNLIWYHHERHSKRGSSSSVGTRLHHEQCKIQTLSIFRYIFHQYVIPLLQQCFYITECEFLGKRVLYYRKPVWSLFRTLSMNKLLGTSLDKKNHSDKVKNTQHNEISIEDNVSAITNNNNHKNKVQYIELSETDVLKRIVASNQQIGISRLRLVPKTTGVRPIATLNKRELITPLVQTAQSSILHSDDSSELDEDIEVDTPFGPAQKKKKLGNRINQTCRIRLANQTKVSTNTMLGDVFTILSYERDQNHSLYGSGLLGMNDFYPRYRALIQKWKGTMSNEKSNQSKQLPRLYFGSVDIRHCYDNIDQEYLISIVENAILSKDNYVIQKYNVYQPDRCPFSNQITGTKFLPKKDVSSLEQITPFRTKIRNIANDIRGRVFVDGVTTIVMNKGQIINQIRDHLTCHMVVTKGRYGNRYLLQSTGIPQGSVLSSLLCNFYYGNIEKRLLGNQLLSCCESSHGNKVDLIARMVDDFLLITTDFDDMKHFFTTMYRGDCNLGVNINKEKTQSSTDIHIESCFLNDACTDAIKIQGVSDSFFPWCGMLFDVYTGEVRVDYKRFMDGKGSDTLTVAYVSQVGEHMLSNMKLFVRPRCLPILYDPYINSNRLQIINYYQMMVYAAIKTKEYINSLRSTHSYINTNRDGGPILCNIPFLIQCIENTICYSIDLIQYRIDTANEYNDDKKLHIEINVNNNRDKKERKTSFLPHSLVIWLGWRSFYDTFRGQQLPPNCCVASMTNDFQFIATTEFDHRMQMQAKKTFVDHVLTSSSSKATKTQSNSKKNSNNSKNRKIVCQSYVERVVQHAWTSMNVSK